MSEALSKRDRFRVLERDGFQCQYCGAAAPDVLLEVDHIHPKSAGGSNDYSNLRTACKDCNRGKGARKMASSRFTGKFFHAFEPGTRAVARQGWVLADFGDLIEVRYYDWMTGRATFGTHVVKAEDAVHWRLYDTAEEMRAAFERDGLGGATLQHYGAIQ